jgi:hypothetical protein
MTQAASRLGLAVLLSVGVGCGPTTASEEATLSQTTQALEDPNGLATNGLATNGLATNGLATNGLATNGLATNGAFANWLNEDPEVRAELMKYVIACAVPAGEVRTYTNQTTGVTYSWNGQLGLTPHWALGNPATEVEEQLVSACLAAHANPYGLHVNFSLLGRNAVGSEVGFTAQELATYNVREACFFGNLFRNEGLYAGNDRNWLDPDESTVRGCGLSRTVMGVNPVCEPIYRIGACNSQICTLDPSGLYYTQCRQGGKTYRPVTTRIQASDINVCGDGVCQVTEHCGKGRGQARTPDNCGVDCGHCP